MELINKTFLYFIENINAIQMITLIIGLVFMLLKQQLYLVFFILFDIMLIFEGLFFDKILTLVLGILFIFLSISNIKYFYRDR